MTLLRTLLPTLPLLLLLVTVLPLQAQQMWVQDFRNAMEIGNIIELESSPLHLYILSEEDGLTVFRTKPDSLQWLYSSTGMQRRGHRLQADARFAYLYGGSRRLTIVEPTSVLGVYSSTILPEEPRSVQRLSNSIYIALGEAGLGRLSLDTPESVDQEPDFYFPVETEGYPVRDIVTDHVSRLYVLLGSQRLLILEQAGSEERPEYIETVGIDRQVDRIFLTDDELIGSDSEGELFLVNSNGRTEPLDSVGEPVQKLRIWDGQLVVRTESGSLFIGPLDGSLTHWKESDESGNYFTIARDRLWIAENDQVSPVSRVAETDQNQVVAATESGPVLRQVENVVIPFPRPLILPIELESGHTAGQVEFSQRSGIHNARIRGQSFYWQPTANQVGRHEITLVATSSDGRTDTTRFSIEVRPFNAPPRFTPVRPVSISIEEEFTLEIFAVDPDGMDPDLIRYLGVDLPDGSSLNETTGMFSWTPNIRQTGEHPFQVIATDQFGAAAQQNITIRVIETDRDAEADLD
ncbi:MAG: putative Ig domain-containing protein [Balneolaceae bacterium]